jgi:hypothetical protein
LAENRLLLVSPFAGNVRRATAETALIRNGDACAADHDANTGAAITDTNPHATNTGANGYTATADACPHQHP